MIILPLLSVIDPTDLKNFHLKEIQPKKKKCGQDLPFLGLGSFR